VHTPSSRRPSWQGSRCILGLSCVGQL
jgi:hypothetical protein